MDRTFIILGIASALCSAALADVAIRHSVAQDGRVSMAIYSQDGQLVRTLLTGAPRQVVTLVKGRLFELMPNGDTYGYEAQTGHVFTGGDYGPGRQRCDREYRRREGPGRPLSPEEMSQ